MTHAATTQHDIEHRWVHVQYKEDAAFVETYGFSGNQGAVNLEGLLMTPKGVPSSTLLIFMHPASTLQLLPVPQAAVKAGWHVLCAASRYAKNDTALILEKVLLDLGAYIRHAKEQWGYKRIVIVGWSGGGSLALFYQSQAERPTITQTPAGDPVGIAERGTDPGRCDHRAGRAYFARDHAARHDRSLGDATNTIRTIATARSTSTTRPIRTSRPIRLTSSQNIARRSWPACEGSRPR